MEKSIERDIKEIGEIEGITEKTKKLIEKFDKENKASNIKPVTRLNYIKMLKFFLKEIKKPIENIEKDDLIEFFSKEKYKETTLNTFKLTLTKFFRWMNGGESLPKRLKSAKKILKQNRDISAIPKNLITQEEVKNLSSVASNPRDRLLPVLLYESACRIGEVLNIKLGDIAFDEYGSKVVVSGKTGERTIRLIDCSPALLDWINNHPYKENKEKPLFVSFKENGSQPVFTEQYARMLLRGLGEKAGIKKALNPHAFRHARLTELAQELTEFEMKVFAGWGMSSKMGSVYVHRSGINLDQKLLANRGLVDLNGKDNKRKALEVVECPNCEQKNTVTNRFCCKCGQGIDPESIEKFEEKQKFKLIMGQAEKDPRFKEILQILENIMSKPTT